MIKALDSSRQAMQMHWMRHEVISDNLANVNTPGFKREMARVTSLEDPSRNGLPSGRQLIVEGRPQLTGGALQATGGALDLAIRGPGFFQVQTPDGNLLTRDGSFTLDAQGLLVHSSGNPVLVDGGSVQITGVPSVLPDGSILDGEMPVGRLTLVAPSEGAQLTREGKNLYRAEGGTREVGADEATVAAGYIESSNVDPVREMVNMIRAFRVYELAQRAAQSADETLSIAVNKVGVLKD